MPRHPSSRSPAIVPSHTDSGLFLVVPPGLEAMLAAEAREKGFKVVKTEAGGVHVEGDWPEAWRANLELRGAVRVLARIGAFRALHLAQLDKRARKFPWGDVLRPDVPVSVEASCRHSRIYHGGAAAQRVATALREEAGITIADDAALAIKLRIEDDLCTISVDTTGEALHKRGHKAEIAKAPMRESMAALFLRACGYSGAEPVVDPMCGSGTFVIEAAEIASGFLPGRSRHFAFEQLKSFNAARWQALQQARPAPPTQLRFYGSDRDAGAIRMAKANAARAGVEACTSFQQHAVSELAPPEGPPGLVMVNPPYGARIGERKPLFGLYGALGKTLLERFTGWRVGLVTTDASLAKATGLPFQAPSAPVLHGGLRVKLFQTGPLPPRP